MKPKSWLVQKTGKGTLYWYNKIGTLIAKHAYWDNDPIHQEVQIMDWLAPLAKEVATKIEKHLPKRFDGNMAFAAVMSYILAGWFTSLARAKAYDPRRPKKVRQKVLVRRAQFCADMVNLMVDESLDCIAYSKQKWDPPFAPVAKDGKYV